MIRFVPRLTCRAVRPAGWGALLSILSFNAACQETLAYSELIDNPDQYEVRSVHYLNLNGGLPEPDAVLGGAELEAIVKCREKLMAAPLFGYSTSESDRFEVELRRGSVNVEVYFGYKALVKGGDAHCFVNMETGHVEKVIFGY